MAVKTSKTKTWGGRGGVGPTDKNEEETGGKVKTGI